MWLISYARISVAHWVSIWGLPSQENTFRVLSRIAVRNVSGKKPAPVTC
jgi:hypothetical protein